MLVTQPQKPLVLVGRDRKGVSLTAASSPGAGASAGGSRTVATIDPSQCETCRSFERIQIADELGDLVLRQAQVGHHRPRLLAGRVAQPGPEVGIGVFEDGAGE